jgi:hypothetical protein
MWAGRVRLNLYQAQREVITGVEELMEVILEVKVDLEAFKSLGYLSF